MGDVRDILRVAAKTLHKPVSTCEIYDQNVCVIRTDAEHHWRPVAVSGFPFTCQVAYKRSGPRLSLMANPEFLRIKVKGERLAEIFSVGRPNRVMCWEDLAGYLQDDARWPVYVSGGSIPPAAIASILSSRDLHLTVELLLTNRMESLHFFRDAVVLYLQPDCSTTVLRATEHLLLLVGPTKPRLVPDDLAALPKEFERLAPSIERWAESDDGERSRLLDKASPSSLRKLVDAVDPHFGGIHRYLTSFGDSPLPDVATQLQTLAECASEARLRLGKKGDR